MAFNGHLCRDLSLTVAGTNDGKDRDADLSASRITSDESREPIIHSNKPDPSCINRKRFLLLFDQLPDIVIPGNKVFVQGQALVDQVDTKLDVCIIGFIKKITYCNSIEFFVISVM